MYVSLSRLRIPPERSAELVAAFRRRARLVEQARGFPIERLRRDLEIAAQAVENRELSQTLLSGARLVANLAIH